MSRTHVQQTQISGSLVSGISDSLEAGIGLVGQGTLVGDLNALRSQLNKIIGEGHWYDALAGAQDLADIYGAMQVSGSNAAFQGDVSAIGDMSAVNATFSGDLGAVNGTFSADLAAVNATLSGDLSAVSGSFSGDVAVAGDVSAADATFSGDLAAVNATLSGDLSAVNGSFSADLSAVNATLSGDLAAVDATLSGDLSAVSGSFSGNVSIAGDEAGRLYIVGLDGTIHDEENITWSPASEMGPALLTVNGDGYFSGDLSAANGSFSADIAAVSGSFSGDVTVTGNVSVGNDISANNAAFIGDMSAVNATLSGDLSAVNGSFSGDIGAVDATLTGDLSAVSGSFSGDVAVTGDVSAADATLSGDLAAVNATLSGDLGAVNGVFSADISAVNGGFSGDVSATGAVGAATGSFSGPVSAGSLAIAGDTAQRLYIVDADGTMKDEANLTFDGSQLAITGDLAAEDAVLSGDLSAVDATLTGNLVAVDGLFSGNVQVDGDLRVKGSMTYIDTQNMRVQDAFIYLATGSAGTTDSGIVLHGGAGASMDLVIGQDGGAGEVIFGKANRAPDGDGAMDGIALVPAWMSEIKLGGVEGSLSGSFAIVGNDMKLEAANNLSLAANGEEIGLMSAAEYTTFDTNFTATSIVGALNELYAAGAGGSKKGSLSKTNVNVSTGVLTFSSIGTLASANHAFVDVYLNGIMLDPSADLTGISTTTVSLSSSIASELTDDDVLTVVLRGAA